MSHTLELLHTKVIKLAPPFTDVLLNYTHDTYQSLSSDFYHPRLHLYTFKGQKLGWVFQQDNIIFHYISLRDLVLKCNVPRLMCINYKLPHNGLISCNNHKLEYDSHDYPILILKVKAILSKRPEDEEDDGGNDIFTQRIYSIALPRLLFLALQLYCSIDNCRCTIKVIVLEDENRKQLNPK